MSSSLTPTVRHTLIVDDDTLIAEGLAQCMVASGRSVITCNDIESAQLVLETMDICEVVADVQFSGRFSYEGLALVRHIRQFAPTAQVVLMSGRGDEELRDEARALGAKALLNKPFPFEDLERLLAVEAV